MLNIADSVYGTAAILGGLVFLFFGNRLFKTIVGLAGFVFGALAGYTGLVNLTQRGALSLGPHGHLITMAICVGTGAAGAAVALWAWMLALLAVGGLGGLSLAIYLLSWPASQHGPLRLLSLLQSPTTRPVFLGSMAAAGAALALVFERALIIGGTAMTGAVGLCSGIDVFAVTGFNAGIRAILSNATGNEGGHHLPRGPLSVYVLLGSCAAIAVIGATIQSTMGRSSKKRRIADAGKSSGFIRII